MTGFREGSRRLLQVSAPLYESARHALERQDDWSYEEHAAFCWAVLPQWPAARGRRPSRDGLSVAAAGLAVHGYDLDQIAAALHISADTLRAANLPVVRTPSENQLF